MEAQEEIFPGDDNLSPDQRTALKEDRDRRWHSRQQSVRQASKSPAEPLIDMIDGDALDLLEFDEIDFVVPGFVAAGLTLLCGKPKIGKSWLGLDIALAVAGGGFAFGDVACERGDVLYLALEDNRRRLKQRLKMILGDTPIPNALHLATTCPRLDQGGYQEIRKLLDRMHRPRLLVIDVLEKIRPRGKGKNFYQEDYASIEPLRQLGRDFPDMAIVALHHVSKRNDAGDPFDLVSGSTGLTGTFDTVCILSRDSDGLKFYGRGRDIEEFDVAMSFDKSRGTMTLLGEASEVRRSHERGRIIITLRDNREPMTPTEIAQASGMKRNNVFRLVVKMATDGEIRKVDRGKYTTLETYRPNGSGKFAGKFSD